MSKLKERLNFWLSVPWNLRVSALGSLVTCALMLISLGVSSGFGPRFFFGNDELPLTVFVAPSGAKA